jgi:hypothetical protein
MISLENKIKFISSERIVLSTGNIIYAKYSCPYNWEFGSILKFSEKLFGKYSSIDVYFDADEAYMFISKTYDLKPRFESAGWEVLFEMKSAQTKNEILDYCDWIASREGQDFVKRIANMKVFV